MFDRRGFHLIIVCLLVLGPIPGGIVRADEPPAARRQRIENMDAVQKEQLLHRHKQFHGFKPEEREQLRNLHRDIENDPNRDELRRILDCYYDWLKTLSSYQLMELRKLSCEERIERIKTLQQKEQVPDRGRRRFGIGRFGPGFDRYVKLAEQISPPDRKAMLAWTAKYAARHEDTFTQSLPDSVWGQLQRELGRVGDSAERMQVLFWRMWLRRQLDAPEKPLPDLDDDWPRLLGALSVPTRDSLEALPEEEQRSKIAGMIRILALEHYFVSRSGPVPSVISDKELAGFFTSDLDQGRRSWLLGLPSADMRRTVWKFYLISKLPRMFQSFFPKGPGGSRRPGSQRHGPLPGGGGSRSDLGRPAPPLGGQLGREDRSPRQGEPRNRTDKDRSKD